MFEFKWKIPRDSPQDVVLRIHSRSGWFGRKVLTLGGRRVFRRGWFQGVDARFLDPGSGRQLHLRMAQIPNSTEWRPVLLCAGQELPEITGTEPPRVVRPPKALAVTFGFTYLLMLLAVVSLPSTVKILNALYLRFEDRRLILVVDDPDRESPAISLREPQLPPAKVGQAYSTQLTAVGGTAPYTWTPADQRWPRGLSLDRETGVLACTPAVARDLGATVALEDAAGNGIESPIAIVVNRATPRGPDYPIIETRRLPSAVLGEPFAVTLQATGGMTPYVWKTLKSRLPTGITVDSKQGLLEGSPTEAGAFAVTIRAIDSSYTPSQDIVPWIIPLLVTAVCLLAVLNMRKWAVMAFGALIVLQGLLLLAASIPISLVALVIQLLLWLVGAAHWGEMR
jgi:hypothetical protein